MPAFRFVAIDTAGKTQRGVMEAPDAGAVVERLQRSGHVPIKAEPAGAGGRLADLLSADLGRPDALRRREVADVVRELATMLGAGQDLDRALRFVVDSAPKPRIRRVMARVRESVRGGASLAGALSAEPRSFPRLHVGLIRAGEAGGALPEALDHLAAMLERERSLRASIQAALVYPALLLAAGLGSIALLMGYVLPQFVPLFEQSGAALPASTRFLMRFGDALRAAAPAVAVAALPVFLVGRQILRMPRLRLAIDRRLLHIPVAGAVMREALAARFARALGTLLRNGVPLIGALAIARDIVGNRAAAQAVDVAADRAKGGAGLARPLAAADVFPARTIHLLRLGEETAQLGAMALRAADIHEERTRLMIQKLVALMVPAITIFMGIAVAAIVGSVLAAMLSLNDLAL